MYYRIIRQCMQALKNLETWLDKAEQHAAAKGFDVGVLLTSRLARVGVLLKFPVDMLGGVFGPASNHGGG